MIVAVFPIIPAHAAPCSDVKEQFFVSNMNSSFNEYLVHGTDQRILLKNRTLSTNCTNPKTLSTAHMERYLSFGTQIEIGWWKHPCSAGSDNCYYIFTEKEVDGTVTDLTEILSPNLTTGTFDRWRVRNSAAVNGVTAWNLDVDFLDGGGWVNVKTYNNNWNTGYAMGEAETFGADGSIYDEHRDMNYKNNSGSWVSFTGQKCRRDTSPDFSWKKVSNQAFDVSQFNGVCS